MLLLAFALEGIGMNVRNRIFDILLVVVILSAASFIGYRYFVSSRSTGSPVAVGTGTAVVVTAPTVNIEREAQRPAHPQWLLVKVLPVEADKYQEVLKKTREFWSRRMKPQDVPRIRFRRRQLVCSMK